MGVFLGLARHVLCGNLVFRSVTDVCATSFSDARYQDMRLVARPSSPINRMLIYFLGWTRCSFFEALDQCPIRIVAPYIRSDSILLMASNPSVTSCRYNFGLLSSILISTRFIEIDEQHRTRRNLYPTDPQRSQTAWWPGSNKDGLHGYFGRDTGIHIVQAVCSTVFVSGAFAAACSGYTQITCLAASSYIYCGYPVALAWTVPDLFLGIIEREIRDTQPGQVLVNFIQALMDKRCKTIFLALLTHFFTLSCWRK